MPSHFSRGGWTTVTHFSRGGLTTIALTMTALAAVACMPDGPSPLEPPARDPEVLQAGHALIGTTWADPEAGILNVCKWSGPAGSYTYHITAKGGGDYRLPFGQDVTLTSAVPITYETVVCRWVYFPANEATWAGKTAKVTITEAHWTADSVPIQKNGVFLPTVLKNGSVTVEMGYNDFIGLYYYNGSQACGGLVWLVKPREWDAAGYDQQQQIGSVFTGASQYKVRGRSLAKWTFLESLLYRGGSTTGERAGLLLNGAVTALLNQGHPEITYGWTKQNIVDHVNAALASGNPQAISDLSATLSMLNHATGGCPLINLHLPSSR